MAEMSWKGLFFVLLSGTHRRFNEFQQYEAPPT